MDRAAFALPLFAALACAACAPTPRQQASAATASADRDARLARELAGLTPGTPQSCISQTRPTLHTTTIGDTILWRVSRNLIYVTKAPGCERAERGDALIIQNNYTQLCRGQIAQTFDTAARFNSGSCAFGDFTPYRRAR